jgi:hypothetical protein
MVKAQQWVPTKKLSNWNEWHLYEDC